MRKDAPARPLDDQLHSIDEAELDQTAKGRKSDWYIYLIDIVVHACTIANLSAIGAPYVQAKLIWTIATFVNSTLAQLRSGPI